MTTVYIEKNINVEPKYLDQNIKETILEKIKTQFLGYCDQEYGYIKNIYPEYQLLDNIVSTAGIGITFKVKFKADIIKPNIGDIYEGKVCMVFSQGILTEIIKKMKVLIPIKELSCWTYDKAESKFVSSQKKGKNIINIKKGDSIDVKITSCKYEKHIFECLGTLA